MWDTSNIENMDYLFFGCKSLMNTPNIKNWKTSKIISMKYIFSETNLKSPPNIANWDLSNLKFCEGLFSEFFNLPVSVIETQCYTMGDEKCVFEIEPQHIRAY